MKIHKLFYIGLAIVFIGGLGLVKFSSGPNATTNTIAQATAPDFTLQALDGQKLTLSQYKDKKPVILDFWTSWCPNCQRDMPKTSILYNKYKDQVEIIGINLSESRGVAEQFVTNKNISFPIALDTGGRVARQYNVRYTNTHVLINIDGDVISSSSSDLTESQIISLIQN